MKKIICIFLSILSLNSVYAQNGSVSYKGMICEVHGNDHREYIERFEIIPEGDHFRAVYTPKYYIKTELPKPRIFPGIFLATYVPLEDPRIVDLGGSLEGEYREQQGKFFDSLVIKEVTEKRPGCCGNYLSIHTEIQIQIKRFFLPTGIETAVEVPNTDLNLHFHPSYCRAIMGRD